MEPVVRTVFGVILLLLVLFASGVTAINLIFVPPVFSLLFLLLAVVALVGSALEIARRRGHLLGIPATLLGTALSWWGFITSPTLDPTWLLALVPWLAGATLWTTLAFLQRRPTATDAPRS